MQGGKRPGAGRPYDSDNHKNLTKAYKLIGANILGVIERIIHMTKVEDKRTSLEACKLILKYYMPDQPKTVLDDIAEDRVKELLSNINIKESVTN